MSNFELQTWHVLVFFGTLLLGIFRNDVSSAINGLVVIREQKGYTGKKIHIQAPNGVWEEVTVLDYKYEIPFIKSGGVVVRHENNGHEEKLSFSNWRKQRIRFV